MKKIFVVSAPSGAGKTTLVQAIIECCAPSILLHRVVTYTSRKPRIGEQEGVDYYFVNVSSFEQKMKSGFFLEWSTAYGAYYGTPADFLGQAPCAKGLIFVVDRLGALKIKEAYPQAITIFVEVPTLATLEGRIRRRGIKDEQDLAHRLTLARQELELEQHAPWHDHRLLNDNFGHAIKDFEEIIKKEVSFLTKNKEFLRQI
jgi:guanylate kinase